MSRAQLVLSLFPGIGLLDRAFEEEGFCVVRGPDLLWGGDIKTFHPPAGVFDGVIGGPPCQIFSSLRRLNRHLGAKEKFGNLIPEFERAVGEARPEWFLMENVPDAPAASVGGYSVVDQLVDDQSVGGKTCRKRRFSFGSIAGLPLSICCEPLFTEQEPAPAVTGNARILTVGARIRSKGCGGGPLPGSDKLLPLATMCEQQGLPVNFFSHAPFKESAKRQMIGNGVPLPMGRAIARAVKAALKLEAATRGEG